MIKQIIKMLWFQKRSNGWIFIELLLVFGALVTILDALLVDAYTYFSPLGYNIENTYQLKLAKLNNKAPGYVLDSLVSLSETESLLKLMENIRQNPEVEEVCATFFSCPYSFGNSWTSITPTEEADTTKVNEQSFQVRRVTPEYFKVFSVLDKEGKAVMPQLNGVQDAVVLSADLEKQFYNNQSAKGRRVSFRGQANGNQVAAVCQPIRPSDYEISAPCFYQVLTGKTLEEYVNYFGAQQAELCVRMKHSKTKEDINHFLEEMGDRLNASNLYVYGVKKIEDQRTQLLSYRERNMKIKFSLMAFLLINVFFGIVGTFWLWTENRRGEIGLRMAIGSSKYSLYKYMNLEGICLFAFTLPFIILFMLNMAYFDIMDTIRLPLSLWRFCITIGSAWLLLAGMITLGIWIPARKATNLAPAEALHYE